MQLLRLIFFSMCDMLSLQVVQTTSRGFEPDTSKSRAQRFAIQAVEFDSKSWSNKKKFHKRRVKKHKRCRTIQFPRRIPELMKTRRARIVRIAERDEYASHCSIRALQKNTAEILRAYGQNRLKRKFAQALYYVRARGVWKDTRDRLKNYTPGSCK